MYYAIDRNTKKHRMTAKGGPISVNEYIVQADADGWIEWHGGECPLPDDCRHQVKHDGDVCDDNRPQTWCWSDKKLTHYRPILEEAKPKVTPNFTIDLATLDIPDDAKWVVQDNDGAIAFSKGVRPGNIDCFWDRCDVTLLCGEYEHKKNPHWHNAITEWPIPTEAESEPTQWRGPQDGLPPVGTVCEFKKGQTSDYVKCKVVAYHFETAMPIVTIHLEDNLIHCHKRCEFRSIRTSEQIAEERAVEAIAAIYEQDNRMNFKECRAIYAAIRDGRIPGVKLE